MRFTKSAVLAAALFFFAACGGGTLSPPFSVVLNTSGERATVEAVGVPADQLAKLRDLDSREAWAAVFRVAVAPDQPPMLGDYSIRGDRVVFVPMFPLDPGRDYHYYFSVDSISARSGVLALPATHTVPTTVVTRIYPGGDAIPENQLRLYIHFSAPMGMKGGLDYIHLLDDQGKEVKDPFLPLDAEFWNDDRTRYTVFFDPGRQKRGIPVIEEMGRSLTAGKNYTIVVDTAWRDGNGLALKEDYRHTFRVGAPDERPLDVKAWTMHAGPVGTRGPLVVKFPEPLDHGLLLRAMGVQGPDGKAIGGEIVIAGNEQVWTFTPREMWQPGTHHLVALGMLEDLAGNRIGRAFEVDQFDRSDKSAEPERTLIPFTVR